MSADRAPRGAYALAGLVMAFVIAAGVAGWWAGLWWALGIVLGLLVVAWVLNLLLRPFVWLAELVEERRRR